MDQFQVFKLNCVNCNSNLEISHDTNKFACGYCGTQQIVERKGGVVQLKGVVDAISKVQTGTDKTAAELALQRLIPELKVLEVKRSDAEKEYDVTLANKKKDLKSMIDGQNTGLGILGCFSIVISLLGSLAILALYQFIVGSIYSIPDSQVKVSLWFILILGIPIFCVAFYFSSKIITKIQNKEIAEKIELLKLEIESLPKAKVSGIQQIDAELAKLKQRIQFNQTIVND